MDTILEALKYIHPADLTYEEWVQVGMALKAEGADCDVWDEWSRDDNRYHEGDCEKKWQTFQDEGITGGTIIHIAEKFGYKRARSNEWDWDTIISPEDIIEAKSTVRAKKTAKPLTLSEQCEQIKAYLNALFYEDEHVGYCTQTMQRDDGKWTPASVGVYGLTAGELIGKLNKVQRKAQNGENADLAEAIGTVNTEAGAWIRFNPLDGEGVKDADITSYRFALVESDTVELEEQESIIRALNLPVAALVSSGSKSIHAIVHIDALDKTEYKRRVDELYTVCEEAGLYIDRQNKNPSRLSRMPGIQRGDKWQRLIDTHFGAADWQAWKEWLNARKDDLPDPVPLSEVYDNPPALAPVLIEGCLRRGHTAIIAGQSKSGKSFSMIELAVALAEGSKWFGYQCAKSKVLLLNFEIDEPSYFQRIIDVYKALGLNPAHTADILVMNLRGRGRQMKELTASVINKALKYQVDAIILDPIYKVMMGDENSASDMAEFMNEFDHIAQDAGCSFIFTHHHSKGEQAYKASQDRMSGSGVLARSPDAIFDFLPIIPTKRQREDAGVSEHATAIKVECTFRDFPSPEPHFFWFDYPIHIEDENLEGSAETIQELAQDGMSKKKEAKLKNEFRVLTSAFNWCESMDAEKKVRIGELVKRINETDQKFNPLNKRTIHNWIDRSDDFERDENGYVYRLENIFD